MLRQLVVDLSDSSVHQEPRSSTDDPVTFDKPDQGQVVPRLGSKDLLRLAAFALRSDYFVDSITVRDRSMSPLSLEEEERVSDRLVEQLSDAGPDLPRNALSGEHGPYTIVEIELLSQHAETIRIGRLGSSSPTLSKPWMTWSGQHGKSCI
jgi:hypothetical protein